MDGQTPARGSSILDEIEVPAGIEIREGVRGLTIRISFTINGERKRAKVDYDLRSPTKKLIQKAIAFAQTKQSQIQAEINSGTFNYASHFPKSSVARHITRKNASSVKTIGDLINTYIDTARKTQSLSPSTIASYARWARSRLLPQWEFTKINKLSTPELRNWISELSVSMSPKSVRNCVGLLSAVLVRAHADGVIANNPLEPIKMKTMLPKRKKQESSTIDPFNQDEIKSILSGCKYIEDRALFQFAFSTGMRTGELVAIKWEHINQANNTIRVIDNIVTGENSTVEKTTKTDNVRDIPILPSAQEALDAMRPITGGRKKNFIFKPHGQYTRWRDDKKIRQRWEIALKAAGVRYRNPYQTRHTFASTLLMYGEPELLVAKLLGHETVEMVRRHYGKYIADPSGIRLRGDYENFGNVPSLSQDDNCES